MSQLPPWRNVILNTRLESHPLRHDGFSSVIIDFFKVPAASKLFSCVPHTGKLDKGDRTLPLFVSPRALGLPYSNALQRLAIL